MTTHTCVTTTTFKPQIWVPGDWNAFFGFGTNILVNLLTLTALLRFGLGFADELVFGRILPAVGLMLFLSTSYYAWLAYDLARRTGRRDVCALPSGPGVGHMFIVVVRGHAADQAADRRPDQGVGGRTDLGGDSERRADPRRLHRPLRPPRDAARRAARHAGGRVDHVHLDAAGAGDVSDAGDRADLLRDPAGQLVRRRALLPRPAGRLVALLVGTVIAWGSTASTSTTADSRWPG